MREEREERPRGEFDRRFEDEPRQRARGALPQRAPGRILDLDAPAGEFGRDAARDRRIGRNERRGFARRLQRLAHGDRQRQALLILVVGGDDRDALKRGGEGERRQRPPALAPEIGRFGGTKRFAQESGARGERGRGRAERRHVLALDADFANQPIEQRLRMAGDAERRVLARADHAPCAIVEVEVEVGQHDRAFWRARDRRDEAGGGAIGAGRAGDDGGPAPRAVERLDLFVDDERDPRRPIDEAALAQPLRPTGEGDLEKIEGDAPIGVIKIGRERLELRPWRALDDHVVDQRREIAREPVSLRGGRRDQRGLGGVEDEAPVRVRPSDRALERLSPGAGEGGERMAAREPADRRGDRSPAGRPRPRDRRPSPSRPARRRRAARCAAGAGFARRSPRAALGPAPGPRAASAHRSWRRRAPSARPRRGSRRSARRREERGSVSEETAPRRES